MGQHTELDPGTSVGSYVVEGMLGAGGQASVFKVRHAALGSPHALKLLHRVKGDVKERLIREGQVQARLQHHNVVRVTDLLDVDGAPGLIMEYIEGGSLDDLLGRRRLPLDEALDVFRGILTGVAVAHRHGIAHRDLKPANVLLVTEPDGRLVPKVADFGLAKLLDDGGMGTTRTGMIMGSPRYMAPEQVRDAKRAGPQADLFSLGAILYELVTGRTAFPQENLFDLFAAIDAGKYEPPETIQPDLPEPVVRAISRCLAPNTSDRAQSCEELFEVLYGPAVRPPDTPPPARLLAREVSDETWGADSLGGDPDDSEAVGVAGPAFDGVARDPAPVAEPGATVEEIRALRRSSGRSPWWLLALGAPVLGAVVVGGVALAWWVVPGVGQTPHATEIADLRPGPVAPLPGPALGGGAGEVDPPEVAPPAAVAVRADPDPPAVDPVPKGRPAPVRPAVAAVGAGGDAATPSPARPDPDPPGTAEPVDPVPPEPPPPETVAVVLPVPTPRPFPSLGVTGVSADRVSLRNPERRFFWPGDPLPPDTYEILLDDAYIAGRVRVDAGMASVSVHCVPELKECR